MQNKSFSKIQQIASFIVIITYIAACIETDIYVPAFPDMQKYFQTTEGALQLILSINFLGLCISGLFYGPLSDSFGRKPLLNIGFGIFTFSSIGCIYVDTIEWLLFWRFLQGLGSGAAFVVSSAIIFDVYSNEKANQIVGYFNSIITLVIAAAPAIGGALNRKFGWQSNFVVITILALFAWMAIIFTFKETLESHKRERFNIKSILKDYVKVTSSGLAMGHLMILCLMNTAYVVYIANLSLIFINHLKVPAHRFDFYQGMVLGVFAISSTLSALVIQYLGGFKTRLIGGIIFALGGLGLMVDAYLLDPTPNTITFWMCLYTGGFALVVSLIYVDYMRIFPHIKGITSAVGTAVRLVLTAGLVAVAGFFYNGTIVPVATIVGTIVILSAILYAIVMPFQVKYDLLNPSA
ncbi:MAG: multidrug transporter [Francisellaceae bacterium]|nr:multidrug transporter [Francisellaceae bacterium]